MKLPQLLHSTRSYGRANSAFSWKLLVLERGFLSYRLKLPCDRSEKDAWFGYSPVGALRKLPFILCSRPAEDWLQRSGSSSTISPTTLFMAARGRRGCSRSSTRRGSREYATTPASMPSVAGTSRVSRGTAADRLAIRIWDSAVGALRKLPFILCSRPAEDWLRRSGSSSTISPTTLFMAARGRRGCSRSSTRRGSREYATTLSSIPPPLRHLSR